MDEERSLVYTLILGVCMLLSLLLIGRMLLGRPVDVPSSDDSSQSTSPSEQYAEKPPEEEVQGIQLTENDLSTLIVQALSFTPDRIASQISRDGTVTINATVRRQTLLDSGIISGGLRTALMFLPDECGMHGAWKVFLKDGETCLSCIRLDVIGISLPEKAAEAATGQIEEKLNKVISEWGIKPVEISFKDGVILIK